MPFDRWFQGVLGVQTRANLRRHRRRKRPLLLETLEDRLAPASTVRVYDENIVAPNRVDFVAAGSTVNNTDFAAHVASAYDRNFGGVIDGSVLSGVYEYGVGQGTAAGKPMIFTTVGSNSTWGIGSPGDGRTISGTGAFATVGLTDFNSYRSVTFTFGAIANGAPNEHVVEFGVTALSLTNRDYGNVTTTGRLASGATVSATRPIREGTAQGDTFYGFTAPAGDYFTGFTLAYDGPASTQTDLRLWFDDIGFVTAPVGAANQAPTATGQSLTTAEDQSVNGTMTASDPDGDALNYVIVTGPGHGSVQFSSTTGAFTYTPAANYNGPDSFSFKANDGRADSNIATVNLAVTPVNDPPVAADQALTTNEDTSVGGTLTATDVDNTTRTFAIFTPPAHGTLTQFNPATGAFVYRPAFDYNGSDSFTFRANDGSANSDTATVSVTINPVNDAPRPTPAVSNATTDEDTPVGGQLAARDPEGDPVTFTAPPEFAPQHGTAVVNPDGTWAYTPAPNYYGTDVFGYRVADDQGSSGVGAVQITINPVDDAPVAVNDAYGVDEDGTLVVAPAAPVSRLFMISDPGEFVGQGQTWDFTPATAGFSAATNFDNGVEVLVDPPGVVEQWRLNFAAPGNAPLTPGVYTGATRFPFQLSTEPGLDVSGYGRGNNLLRGTFTVYDIAYGAGSTITRFAATFVQQTDDFGPLGPPLHGAIVFNSTFGAAGGVLANDTDAESDLLLGATLVTGPAHGTLSFNGDGTFAYTPAANFHGTDSFTYRTADAQSQSNVATVTITVNPVNDAPTAADEAFATDEDTPLTLAAPGVLGNDTDVDGDALRAVLVSGPAHGALTLNADGSLTYTPAADFNGGDSFTYRASDGSLTSSPATVRITVNPVNDAPVAANDTYTVQQNAILSVPAPGVLGNDSDVDSPTLTAAVVAGPASGTLTLDPNGSFTYVPSAGFTGTDTFTYRAGDGSATSGVATVTVRVTPAPSTAGKMNGHGSTDGGARQLDVNVQAKDQRGQITFSGNVGFTDRQAGIDLQSTSITALRVESDGIRAVVSGTATVNGRSGYTFTLFVDDRGEPGAGRDTFRIVIAGPGGFGYDSLDAAVAAGVLDSGNLQVHKK
jgi:VCBS repeat-containing protein